MSVAAGAGESSSTNASSVSHEVSIINKIQGFIDSYVKEHPEFSHKLIVMVGGADFFHITRQGLKMRTNPYELSSLVTFLQQEIYTSEKKEKKEDIIYHILCFDSYYTVDTVRNDIEQANRYIYMEKFKRHFINEQDLKELTYGYLDDFLHIEDIYDLYDYYADDNIEGVARLWHESEKNIFIAQFTFIKMNLETSYPTLKNNLGRLFEFSKGETLLKTTAEECVPKENSTMKALQILCQTIPFQEYYLYNCAWIKGTQFYKTNNGKIYKPPEKTNRYFELLCELLYIFLHTGKPSYLLSAQDMNVFSHKNQMILSKNEVDYYKRHITDYATPLNIIPLNDTTLFKKEEWVNTTKKGGTRKQKKKARKTRRWHK